MNIRDFNNAMCFIRHDVDSAHFSLKYHEKFPTEKFSAALENIQELITKDDAPFLMIDPAWYIARRVVEFKDLSTLLTEIASKASFVSDCRYDVEKIKSSIIPSLTKRIQQLRSLIGINQRLPFSKGSEREKRHYQIKQALHMQDVSNNFYVQKEYFHLMSKYFNNIESRIDVEKYSGSTEIFSLESWEKILQLFVENDRCSDKMIGKKVLSAIQKAIPLAIKTSFAYHLSQINKSKDQEQELEQELFYLRDFINLESSILSKNHYPWISEDQFSIKYQLEANCSIPRTVIINEMAWDMIDSIKKLKAGEFQLFPLGTRDHSVAVAITCIEPATYVLPGNYQYTIFNTGAGVSAFHQLDQSLGSAYPLVFNHLPMRAFSYPFFAGLLRIFLEGEDEAEFYHFHENALIKIFEAQKVLNSGSLYPLQKFGTCAYSSIEVWVESFFDSEQKQLLESVKIKFSLDKQVKLIEILAEDAKKSSVENGSNSKKRKIIFIDKDETLKESRVLLDLGKKYFKSISGDRNLN